MDKKDLVVGRLYIWGPNGKKYFLIGFNENNDPVFQLSKSPDSTPFFSKELVSWKEYKEPVKGEFWLNIYPNQLEIIKLHKSKHEADEHAHKTRLACVHVKWTEGEGL